MLWVPLASAENTSKEITALSLHILSYAGLIIFTTHSAAVVQTETSTNLKIYFEVWFYNMKNRIKIYCKT
jgi:hypothetical protein